jgi:hypothetical protein
MDLGVTGEFSAFISNLKFKSHHPQKPKSNPANELIYYCRNIKEKLVSLLLVFSDFFKMIGVSYFRLYEPVFCALF